MKKIKSFALVSGVFVFALSVLTHAQSPTPSQSSLVRPRSVVAQQQQQAIAPAASATPTVNQTAPPVTATLPAPSATAPASATSVPVPQILYVPAVPLQPAQPLAPNRARARITEAKASLKSRLVATGATVPSIYLVTLAALDPDTSQVHLLSLPKQTLLTKGAEVMLNTSQGMSVRLRVVRPNFVNTAVVISDATGKQLHPLVVEYPIEKGGRFTEMAYYTSAHPALISPDLVKTGQNYVRTMLDLAAKRLKDKGVRISPDIVDVAERLSLVEHVDHGRFRNENRLATYEEVYALYALNELDTYRYSVSWAGAGGMVQMIPSTYQMVRRRHPSVGLNPDFVPGMRNHGNALEAMLLYMQDTWNDLLLNSDVNYAYQTKLATQPELLAAGYNSNPARLGLYIRRGGTAWRTLIPRETQMYLQIYKSVESLVQFKTRGEGKA